MNIKEIIDAERWAIESKGRDLTGIDSACTQHNSSLDRIETEVTKYIFELEKRPEVLPTMGLMMQVVDVQEQRIAELEAELKKPVVKQYYYRVSGCKAKHPTDPDCICWHDKGTGPVAGREEEFTLEWRTKPNHDKHRITDLETENKCLSDSCRAITEKYDTANRRIAELEFDKANMVDRIIGLEIHKTGVIGQANRISELEEQNLNMMALFRDFYELEFNRDECWEIIKKYGGDA